MRGRYTILYYQILLKEYSLCSHKLCLGFFFSLKVFCDYISAFQTETYRGFIV